MVRWQEAIGGWYSVEMSPILRNYALFLSVCRDIGILTLASGSMVHDGRILFPYWLVPGLIPGRDLYGACVVLVVLAVKRNKNDIGIFVEHGKS